MKSKEEPKPIAPAAPGKAGLHVFECCVCHKVFEADRPSPRCTECESEDVEDLG